MATIPDEMLEDAMYISVRSADSVTFTGGEEAARVMRNVSQGYGVGTDQIEAYAAWTAAINLGAYRSTVTYFRNQITDFQTTEEAGFAVVTGIGRNAQGQILYYKPKLSDSSCFHS